MRIFLCGRLRSTDAIQAQMQANRHVVLRYRDESVNDVADWPLVPDMIVSVGYLHILLPQVFRKVPSINCHYALLPRHRGRSSVPWMIAEGDTYAGVTWHWIEEYVDTGRILTQAAVQIDDDDTQATLFEKLHDLAIDSWTAAFLLAQAKHDGWKQRGVVTYHHAGPPNGGMIDPAWPDDRVERFIRAMTYPPLPYARLDGAEVRTMADYYHTKEAHG